MSFQSAMGTKPEYASLSPRNSTSRLFFGWELTARGSVSSIPPEAVLFLGRNSSPSSTAANSSGSKKQRERVMCFPKGRPPYSGLCLIFA